MKNAANRRLIGAADGVRTRDFQNHNLALLPAELQPPDFKQELKQL